MGKCIVSARSTIPYVHICICIFILHTELSAGDLIMEFANFSCIDNSLCVMTHYAAVLYIVRNTPAKSQLKYMCPTYWADCHMYETPLDDHRAHMHSRQHFGYSWAIK